jgi:hypothetical protein
MTRLRAILLVLLAMVLGMSGATAVMAAGNGNQGLGGPNFDEFEATSPLYRWSLGFDEENEAMMRDAFTDDARFVFYLSTGGDPLVFEGIDAVMDLFLGAIADQELGEVRRHVTTNPVVERLDRTTVKVTSYLTLFASYSRTERPTLLSTGVYTDMIVREDDGVWRIQERQLRLDTPS